MVGKAFIQLVSDRFKDFSSFWAERGNLCARTGGIQNTSKETSKNEPKKVQLSQTTLEDATFSYPSDVQELDVGEQDYPVVAYLLNEDGSNFNLEVETLPNEMSLKE
ncbi:hypothetical protein [Bacillus sp. B-jedd]|uniref:hypothetical protein n=1 Tax=Bacillus sp. B-jedd TaxID=1476857 RepID=UPI0005156E52|nr:hypothetical protein [Bacillus sp. B-jedd]CEG26874.1 hypothetical protein BN1002_01726 [Bacillus sp. B-jedd]